MFRNIEVKMIENWLLCSILIVSSVFAVSGQFDGKTFEGKIYIFNI